MEKNLDDLENVRNVLTPIIVKTPESIPNCKNS